MKVSDILKELELRAPKKTAESWDNVGLLVGDPQDRVRTAVVSIDLTSESIQTAKRLGANVIVNHHPSIFPRSRGLSSVTAGNLSYEAARAGISVIACHTNFDQCALEVPEAVSKGLGFEPFGRLHDSESALRKLVVFVPESHVEKLRLALADAGAGRIGNYDSCMFSASGEGQFRGNASSRPFIGKAGKLKKVREFRVETVFPTGLEAQILRTLFQAHPYEEIAYDIVELKQPPAIKGIVSGLGYGVWGEFKKPKAFPEVAKNVTNLFQLTGFWVTEPKPAQIRKIGFVAGKGSSFLSAAKAVGCDLFITGEAGYHDALKGARSGVSVMELGHRESEKFFPITVRGWLRELGLKVNIVDAPTQTLIMGSHRKK